MKASKPVVYVKFRGEAILAENGRLVFAIVNAFADSGHKVKLFESVKFGELGPPGTLIYSIKGVDVTKEIPRETEEKIYIFDKKDKAFALTKWKKQIQVKFDMFSSYKVSRFVGGEPLMFPYPMHPWNYRPDLDATMRKARKEEKKCRIFFAGDIQGYKRNRIVFPKPKMTRSEIVNSILTESSSEVVLISDDKRRNEVLSEDYLNKIVIVDLTKVFVDNWLLNLGKAHFFLCPPGYVMPMCHNSVEALAVGTIPIINYPEWFNPKLQHMENCIEFDDKEDLFEKVKLALAMDDQNLERMRRNAIEYYDKYLDPARFIEQVEARREKRLKVVLITDLCVAKYAKKLKSDSILIRGTKLPNQ